MTTTRFQDLEQQIQTLQEEHKKQIQKLQEEIDRLKKEEQETKLPKDFNRELVIKFLNTFEHSFLRDGFNWSGNPGWYENPQDDDSWYNIYINLVNNRKTYKVPEEAIIQLQKWVIQSYQQQYGN